MSDRDGSRRATSLTKAVRYACSGVAATFRNERNFRIEVLVGVLALVACVLLALEPAEWAIVILLIALVLILELMNSALERLTDLASPEVHPLAKYVKDAMAGAVLIAALASLIIGLVIYISAGLRLWGV